MYQQQKERPTLCRYCNQKIIFMKVIPTGFRPVEHVKRVYDAIDTDTKVVDEQGLVSTMGRRVGWKLHECLQKPVMKMDADS